MAVDGTIFKNKVAYAVNYDINDTDASNHIQMLIDAGIDDMLKAGVPETVFAVDNSPLVIATLVIFVNDNLNMTSGKHTMSLSYIANVDKLRSIPVVEVVL